MERLVSIWQAMEPRQRLVLGLSVLGLIAVLVWLVRVAAAPSMSLLYAGLDPPAAAEVVAALDGRGVTYELRGQAIYVPDGERDRLRLGLAAEGLPATGPAGYELLDSISGFSTTSEMFDATYWRAKEGELARTLIAAPGIRAARVHVANPQRRPFQRASQPTASVILTGRAGPVDAAQAEAARYLVASAVAGLTPQSVTVIDSTAGVILRAGEETPGTAPGLDGTDRAAALRLKLERLLAARVGPGKAVVEVTVDVVMETETISERVIDPDSRVAISTETEESSETSEGTNTAGLTIASNLPDAAATDPGQGTKRETAESRERINFEISEIRRERIKMPGDVRRVSVAVLVDGVETAGPDGLAVVAPRPDAELAQLEALVKSAIGFDEARGDVVTVASLEFTPGPDLGPAVEPGFADLLALNAMTLIQLGVLALVALALGLFVLRPMLAGGAVSPARDGLPAPLDQAAPGVDGTLNGPDGTALAGADPGLGASLEAAQEIIAPEGHDSLPHMLLLRGVIQDKPEETADLLRSWLESGVNLDEEEAA
ncbi:MAG: flagellar basal-body MS-ring/collar protein FliF [Pseudomonadota bacterium]